MHSFKSCFDCNNYLKQVQVSVPRDPSRLTKPTAAFGMSNDWWAREGRKRKEKRKREKHKQISTQDTEVSRG